MAPASVDFPELFGPMIAHCSLLLICQLVSLNTVSFLTSRLTESKTISGVLADSGCRMGAPG